MSKHKTEIETIDPERAELAISLRSMVPEDRRVHIHVEMDDVYVTVRCDEALARKVLRIINDDTGEHEMITKSLVHLR